MQLTGIFLYPVKSLQGISLDHWPLAKRGLKHDRRWMLIDRTGKFISQRTLPEMVFLKPSLERDQLLIKDIRKPDSSVAVPIAGSSKNGDVEVRIWSSRCLATGFSNEVDRWLSTALDTECRLVYMPESTRRKIDAKHAEGDEIVSFADAYPYLIIGEQSLRDLNARLDFPVEMTRFRPNLTFSGGAPYVEDSWKNFTIGTHQFRGVKPCARCVLTTIDPVNARRGKEPLATLATYRQTGHDVLFGLNACYVGKRQNNEIRLGDPISNNILQY